MTSRSASRIPLSAPNKARAAAPEPAGRPTARASRGPGGLVTEPSPAPGACRRCRTSARTRRDPPRSLPHRREELLAPHRLAVVPREEQVGPGAERRLADHRADHPHDLGPLHIDRRGEQLGDLAVPVRPRRMRLRPGILAELRRAQRAHVLDPLDRSRAAVGAETRSRNTVRPSLSVISNQSRQVTRLPDQLWKYSCATSAAAASSRRRSPCRGSTSTCAVVEIASPLFSIAPKPKPSSATTL